MEFGVGGGASLNHLATSIPLRNRCIFGFDSFCGLPEPWGDYQVGHFACDPPPVSHNVRLVMGLFSDSIPPFLATHDGPAALVHIDCDLGASVRTVLNLLTPRIVAGTVIELDEYYILIEHEQRAFHEWLSAHSRNCRHECRSIEQLCVVME